MKNVVMCLVVMALLPVPGVAQANDLELLGFGADIHGSVGVTYQSQYVWRGFDIYDDDSAVQLTANLDLFDSGFGVTVAGHRANCSGHENGERWDFNLYYQNSLFNEDVFATKYRVGWVYYAYPQLHPRAMDLQEFSGVLAWPKITGVQGLIPSYALVMFSPFYSASPGVGSNASGFLHIAALDYSFAVPGAFPETPEQIFKIHSELVFNDGVSPLSANVDHGWSHAVLGVSTDIDLGYGVFLVPSVNYQISMERSVNPDNEVWATVGARYNF